MKEDPEDKIEDKEISGEKREQRRDKREREGRREEEGRREGGKIVLDIYVCIEEDKKKGIKKNREEIREREDKETCREVVEIKR